MTVTAVIFFWLQIQILSTLKHTAQRVNERILNSEEGEWMQNPVVEDLVDTIQKAWSMIDATTTYLKQALYELFYMLCMFVKSKNSALLCT